MRTTDGSNLQARGSLHLEHALGIVHTALLPSTAEGSRWNLPFAFFASSKSLAAQRKVAGSACPLTFCAFSFFVSALDEFSLCEKRGMVIQGVFLFAFGPYLAGLISPHPDPSEPSGSRARFGAQSIVFLTFTNILHMRFAFF